MIRKPIASTRRLRAGIVLIMSVLAFLAFYGKAYFSEGGRGMLGSELKDTIAQVSGYIQAWDGGGSLYWDADYFQYNPRLPQAPIQSPITWLILGLHSLFDLSSPCVLLAVLMVILAIIQLAAVWSMYFFLRSQSMGFFPSLAGALAYAFNHQTMVFGIRHGYERIAAIALLPLVTWAIFKLLQSSGRQQQRVMTILSGLLLGLTLIMGADVKPAAFFCGFYLLVALIEPGKRGRKLLVLGLVFLIALGIFLVQALPTYYAYRVMNRGSESIESRLDYSLSPMDLILTHVSTGFTPRPDYPWENTVEFSMSMFVVVILGIFLVRRYSHPRALLAGLVLALIWIMGKHTPLSEPMGWIMGLTGLRHPVRMSMLLYFIYSILIAHGLTCLNCNEVKPSRAIFLLLLPVGLLILRLSGSVPFSRLTVICPLAVCLVIWAKTRGRLKNWAVPAVIGLFLLEETSLFSTLAEDNRSDPTIYIPCQEIYSHQPREEELLSEPDHSLYRTFIAAKDHPDLFSHNYYLSGIGFPGEIRPIWPYFCLDEEFSGVTEVKEIMLSDWSNPFWDILRVKYIVDLDSYFNNWDEEDTSREGLGHLKKVGKIY